MSNTDHLEHLNLKRDVGGKTISELIEADHIINELASIAYETTNTMAPELDLDEMDPGTWRVVAVNVLKKFAELTA